MTTPQLVGQAVIVLLTLDEISARVRLSPSTIYRRMAEGTFPKPRKRRGRGSPSLWHTDDIVAWERRREQ